MPKYLAVTHLPSALVEFISSMNELSTIRQVDPISGKVTLELEADDLWDLRSALSEIEMTTSSIGYGGVTFDKTSVKEVSVGDALSRDSRIEAKVESLAQWVREIEEVYSQRLTLPNTLLTALTARVDAIRAEFKDGV